MREEEADAETPPSAEHLDIVLGPTISADEVLAAETLLARMPGVSSAAANPLTGQLRVAYNPEELTAEDVVSAVKGRGFALNESPDAHPASRSRVTWGVLMAPVVLAVATFFPGVPENAHVSLTLFVTFGVYLFAVAGPRTLGAHLATGVLTLRLLAALAMVLCGAAMMLAPAPAGLITLAATPLAVWLARLIESRARAVVRERARAQVDAGEREDVREAQRGRPENQRLANQLAKAAPYGAVVFALLALLFWGLAPEGMGGISGGLGRWLPWTPQGGAPFAKGLWAAGSTLLLCAPVALALAYAPGLYVASAWAWERGVRVRHGETWHALYRTRVILFGRTGIVTQGELRVTDVIPVEGVAEEDVLRVMGAVEAGVQHPIGEALARAARRAHVPFTPTDTVWFLPRRGVIAEVDEQFVVLGGRDFVSEHGVDVSAYKQDRYRLAREGKSVVYVAREGELLGLVGLLDKLAPDVVRATKAARAIGVRTALITAAPGDAAQVVADQLGVQQAHGDLAPGKESRLVEAYKRETIYRVAAYGDGFRHATLLDRAHLRVQRQGDPLGDAEVLVTEGGVRAFVAALQMAHAAFALGAWNLLLTIVLSALLLPLGLFGWFTPPLVLLLTAGFTWWIVGRAVRLATFDAEADAKDRLKL